MAQKRPWYDITIEEEQRRIRRSLRKTLEQLDTPRQAAVLVFARELACPGNTHQMIYGDTSRAAEQLSLA